MDEISAQPSWSFLVADLEAVRADLWELGVEVARDSGAPDQIYREANMWSLYMHDPDGNLIHLVELHAERAVPSLPSTQLAATPRRVERMMGLAHARLTPSARKQR